MDDIKIDLDSFSFMMIRKIVKDEDDMFRKAILDFAEPPIKGEITKGKLRYRKIKLIHNDEGLNVKRWIEQRGVKISPVSELKFKR